MAIAAQPVWLVFNHASGSNEAERQAALRSDLEGAGFAIHGETDFPDEPLPTAHLLDRKGIALVAVFTGDGSINALVTHLAGWEGGVLVLPGGTMNLLSKRLHGDAGEDEIVARLTGNSARLVRPGVIETSCGLGLSGVLAGPGASWGEVREAMRDYDIPAMAEGAAHAIGETTAGPRVRCIAPELGRDSGYPLILLSPHDDGIELAGYYADDVADYAKQAAAISRRDFRNGPHETLGSHARLVLGSENGSAIELLLDGESCEAGARVEFVLVESPVRLVATVT